MFTNAITFVLIFVCAEYKKINMNIFCCLCIFYILDMFLVFRLGRLHTSTVHLLYILVFRKNRVIVLMVATCTQSGLEIGWKIYSANRKHRSSLLKKTHTIGSVQFMIFQGLPRNCLCENGMQKASLREVCISCNPVLQAKAMPAVRKERKS